MITNHATKLHHRGPFPNRGEVWLEKTGLNVQFQTVTPTGSGTTTWQGCREAGCLGRIIRPHLTCLAHCTPEERNAVLVAASSGALDALSLDGVLVTQPLLDELWGHVRRPDNTIRCHLSFVGAQIAAALNVQDLALEASLTVNGAIFTQSWVFRRCSFQSSLGATHIWCHDGAINLLACTLASSVTFDCLHADRTNPSIQDCTFSGRFSADGAVGSILLTANTFQDDLSLRNGSCNGIHLYRNTFARHVNLNDTTCEALLANDNDFATETSLGPLNAKYLNLEAARFGARVRIAATVDFADFSSTRFERGGAIDIAGTTLSLAGSTIGSSLRVTGTALPAATLPELISIDNADVSQLSLAGISLDRCIISRGHGLQGLTLDASVALPSAPGILPKPRRCIADETAWRASASRLRRFRWTRQIAHLEELYRKKSRNRFISPASPSAAQVAATYRALRKSYEASANQPGAADLYYGEMEMRRFDATAPLGERAIVFLYWALSGYGLRASRPLIALLLLFAVGSLLLPRLATPPASLTPGAVAIVLARTVVPGFRTALPLTPQGQWMELAIHILAPILFGLFLLSLRGRVKR